MTVTPEIRQEILADHAKNPQRFSPFRTATRVGVPIGDVFNVIAENKESAAAHQMTNDGFGRPELQSYAVARKKAMSGGWKNGDEAIAEAREAYEAGTHIMVSGRDGPWIILYSIPRKGKVEPQPKYFSMEQPR